jgi:DNA-binding XRE family transcriptional regulator
VRNCTGNRLINLDLRTGFGVLRRSCISEPDVGLADMDEKRPRRSPGTPQAIGRVDHVVGERLRQRREQIGWSKADLALAAGYTIEEIADFEAAKCRAGPPALARLCEALQVPIGYVFVCSETPAFGPPAEVIPISQSTKRRPRGRRNDR